MSDPRKRCSLRPTQSPQEWAAYHAIRRDAIFAPLLPEQAYDERDPDEFEPGNLPHVLIRDGEVVGTVRIDLIDETQAGLRLIGIRRDSQRQGLGAVLLELAERASRAFGRTEVVITAYPPRSPSISPTAIARVRGRTRGRCRQRSSGSASGCHSGRETLTPR
jgi:GNAT superfamily N-acetyltransferase